MTFQILNLLRNCFAEHARSQFYLYFSCPEMQRSIDMNMLKTDFQSSWLSLQVSIYNQVQSFMLESRMIVILFLSNDSLHIYMCDFVFIFHNFP